MKEIIIIAWRNLWRNKRRTIITVSSIFFALFYAILMRSFQLGTYNQMLDNTVTQFTGHLQIQDKDYFDNPSIDYSFEYSDKIKDILNSDKNVNSYFPVINTGALASSGPDSKVAMIMGIDFAKEAKYKGLDKSVAKYFLDSTIVGKMALKMDKKSAVALLKYKNDYYNNVENIREDLSADGFDTTKYLKQLIEKTALPKVDLMNFNGGVLVGYELAGYLDLNIGDSIILFGQGFQGNTAVGKYKISGFLNFPIDNLNRMAIDMPLKTCQMFVSAYNVNNSNDTSFYVNYIAINTIFQTSVREQDYNKILNVKTELESKLDDKMLTLVGWRNLNKNLVETIQIGDAKGMIFTTIFYLIIAFGVLGTVMMMIAERKREFGIMMALGMKRKLLSAIVGLELIFMGFIASIAGVVFSAPLIWLGHNYPLKIHGAMSKQLQTMNMQPILVLEKFGPYIYGQIEVVFFIVLVVLIYAVIKISNLKLISSLRA